MRHKSRAYKNISILLSSFCIAGCVVTGCGDKDASSFSESEEELTEDEEYWAGEDGTANEDAWVDEFGNEIGTYPEDSSDEDGWVDEDGNEIGTDSGDGSDEDSWIDEDGNEFETDSDEGSTDTSGKSSKNGNGKAASGKTQNTADGTYYDEVTFVESGNNIPTLRSIIPRGWTTSAYLEQVYDVSNPLRATSVATSADGKSKIYFSAAPSISQMTASNCENYTSGSVNTTNYQLCLDYKDADTWSDFTIQGDLGGGDFIDGEEFSDKDISAAKTSFYNSQIKPYEAVMSQANATITDYGITAADRTYKMSDGTYAEVYSMVTYYDIHKEFGYGLYSEYRFWQPYTFVSIAPDKASLKDQKKTFEMFIANGAYAPELKYVNTQLQNKITAAMQERNNEMFKVTNEVVSNAFDSYDESSSSGSDTNDRVAEMWDDAILDQDNYQLSDGSDVKVSTDYGYVYDMGDGSVFASDSASADPGVGYTPMSPSY